MTTSFQAVMTSFQQSKRQAVAPSRITISNLLHLITSLKKLTTYISITLKKIIFAFKNWPKLKNVRLV